MFKKEFDIEKFKKIIKEKLEKWYDNPLERIKLLVDLWYQWIVWDYSNLVKEIEIPQKKPRKSKNNPNPELTEKQKEENKTKSKSRVKVENAIWWAKRLWIISTVFRNKCDDFNDTVMEISCALWNFHLSF